MNNTSTKSSNDIVWHVLTKEAPQKEGSYLVARRCVGVEYYKIAYYDGKSFSYLDFDNDERVVLTDAYAWATISRCRL